MLVWDGKDEVIWDWATDQIQQMTLERLDEQALDAHLDFIFRYCMDPFSRSLNAVEESDA